MVQNSSGKTPPKKGRDERLKAALRENLRRRKAQVRGRGEKDGPAPLREPETGAER